MEKLEIREEIDQKLRDAILDAIGEGITIIDEDLKIIWVNPIIEKWAGSLEEIKGKNCYKVYQKRDTPCENCPSLKTFKSGKIEKARQYAYDNEGNIKYLEFISSPMKDQWERTTAVVELAVDLTEKIELEHKLKVTKDRLQVIFDNISDGISVIDKDYQILRVNQGLLELFKKKIFQIYWERGVLANIIKTKVFAIIARLKRHLRRLKLFM